MASHSDVSNFIWQIADFLNRQTARLDALIATKVRWLELLAEKCRALITAAVTGKLELW
jgi:type I restriction enzyme S subunit